MSAFLLTGFAYIPEWQKFFLNNHTGVRDGAPEYLYLFDKYGNVEAWPVVRGGQPAPPYAEGLAYIEPGAIAWPASSRARAARDCGATAKASRESATQGARPSSCRRRHAPRRGRQLHGRHHLAPQDLRQQRRGLSLREDREVAIRAGCVACIARVASRRVYRRRLRRGSIRGPHVALRQFERMDNGPRA
jgi:hypothetical protein